MTTIAADARQGLMIADTRISLGETSIRAKKIRRVKGLLIAAAGDVAQVREFERWFTSGADPAKRPTDFGEFEALILDPAGLWYVDAVLNVLKITSGYYAIGSGGPYALGALAAGAELRRAVRIGCDYDRGSAPPLQTMRFTRK